MTHMFRGMLIAMLSSFIAFGAQAATPTKQDAQEMVDQAAALASSGGKDKLISEVNLKDGPFHKGELYVFVYDLTGTTLAHPVDKTLLGKNNVDKPDAEGKLFRKDIIETANKQGSGWVDYKFLNPVSGKVEAKTSYVKKQGDVVIVAGVYK